MELFIATSNKRFSYSFFLFATAKNNKVAFFNGSIDKVLGEYLVLLNRMH